ncbi:MAG: alpha-mannosidase [Treponemataceae bacterium]
MEKTKELKLEHFLHRSKEMYKYRFVQSQDVSEFHSQSDSDETNGKLPPSSGQWNSYTVGKDTWQGHDSYLWLKTKIAIPQGWKNSKVVFYLDGICYNHVGQIRVHDYSGPIPEPKWMGIETMFFLNGQPYQGIDDNHPMAAIPAEFIGKEIEVALRVWSGTDPQSKDRPYVVEIRCAKIAVIDQGVEDCYFWTLALHQSLMQTKEVHPYHQKLYHILDKAHKTINWTYPSSEDFRKTCKEAAQTIQKSLEALPNIHHATDYATGHTHIDVAWLWRLRHVIEKTARSWSTAVRNMEEDKDFVFLQSQPQLYSYVKEFYPKLFDQVKQKVKEGKWEPDGAMWVEPDCNLTSGEALVRQVLYGKRFFKEEFGRDSKFLWLPDVFGYSAALPQILKKSGVDTFITSKISWNQYNRFPHDLFWWRGIDGTDVLTTYIVTPEPKPRQNWYYTYNAQMTAEVVDEAWEAFIDKDRANVFVHPYGWGDGGGGTTYEQLHMRKKLSEIPSLPHIKSAQVVDFCNELHKQVKNPPIPVAHYVGEMYLEYHRGTYTSQALIKKYNRKNELGLAHAEMIGVLGFLVAKKEYDKNEFRKHWQTLLRNQFHDILPGSSIHNVYVDAHEEHREIEAFTYEHNKKLISDLSNHKQNHLTVFNPLLHKRTDVIKIPYQVDAEKQTWMCENTVLATQKVGNELWLKGAEVPSVGWTTICFEDTRSKQASSIFSVQKAGLETPFYTIAWNEAGQITRLYDKENHRELFITGQKGNVFELLEDKPRNYDAWEFEPYAEEKTTIVTDFKGVTTVSDGEIALVLHFTWAYGESVISQDVAFYADSKQIDFKTHVDWKQRDQILRSAWTVDITSDKATFDIQCGNVERPTHRNTTWEEAKFEVPAHRWADLSEKNYGFAILNDCKYGHSVLHNTIRLTLLKGSSIPDSTADYGEHEFTYSIVPHKDNWIDAGVVEKAAQLNNPFLIFDGDLEKGKDSLVKETTGAFIELDACKLHEDSKKIVVRVHEYAGMRQPIKLEFSHPPKKWQESDLLENGQGDMQCSKDIEVTIYPYEIKTFVLEM